MRDKLYESLQLRSTYVARIMVSRYERKVFWFHAHELPHPQLATEGRGKLKNRLNNENLSPCTYLVFYSLGIQLIQREIRVGESRIP